MSVSDRYELAQHYGHEVEVAIYGEVTLDRAGGNTYESVTIECIDCSEVLIDAETQLEDA